MTADYDPLTLPATYFEGLPPVPNNLPMQPEPVCAAHVHKPLVIAASCECGERVVWDLGADEVSAIDHNWAAVLRRIFA